MKFKFYCVVIVTTISCLNATANDDETNGCLERYLMRKGKLPSDYPARQSASVAVCNLVTTSILSDITERFELSHNDTSNESKAECYKREFRNEELADLKIKLRVIQQESQLPESVQKMQITETLYDIGQKLAKIAVRCKTDENKFNEQLGVKNETAMELNYCFAKYAAENELLPLKNINLNPHDIVITNIVCEAIIAKERLRRENEFHIILSEKGASIGAVNCILNVDKEHDIFNKEIVINVLAYVELPKETKGIESEKAEKNFADGIANMRTCMTGI
ncbi:hypothetical protein HA402_009196 [Bradysia odoriphaga]|nr:hypothetical protein HA402_009196 [Bradysia odoriphaga]